MLFTMVADAADNISGATVDEGTLTVKARKCGRAGATDDTTTNPLYRALSECDGNVIPISAMLDLPVMAKSGGARVNGPQWPTAQEDDHD